MAWRERSEERGDGTPRPTAECQFSARDETEDEDDGASSLPALPHSDAKVRSKRLVLAGAVRAPLTPTLNGRRDRSPWALLFLLPSSSLLFVAEVPIKKDNKKH